MYIDFRLRKNYTSRLTSFVSINTFLTSESLGFQIRDITYFATLLLLSASSHHSPHNRPINREMKCWGKTY